jgi:type I restriction enzyme R subunit
MARELAETVKHMPKLDWTVRENVRAQMRVIIKRILRKYGYPTDKQARATELVFEQAEVLCRDWTDLSPAAWIPPWHFSYWPKPLVELTYTLC